MTTGQLLFYSGVALLVLTILLAAVFSVKKPRYDPETADGGAGETGSTRKLRSGYPTDPLTIRREGRAQAQPIPGTDRLPEAPAQSSTVRLTEEVASGTAVLPEEGTTPLSADTGPEGTIPLAQEEGTVPLEIGTTALSESKATRPLDHGENRD